MNKNLHQVANEVHPTPPLLHKAMFRVTTQKKRSKVLLTVEGRLAGDSVSTLEQCWRELRGASPTEKFNVDLCGVSFIDAAGKSLLKEIHRQGGRLVAEGCLNQATVEEITGEAEKGNDQPQKKDKHSHIIFYIALFSLLLTPALVRAQQQTQPAQSQTSQPAEAPGGAMRFTLDQAVALALKQNTTARIAVLTAAQSEQDQKIALSELLPQANLGVTEQWQRVNIRAQFGGEKIFPNFPGHIGPYSIFSAGPSFNGPVFDLTLFPAIRPLATLPLPAKPIACPLASR
jgi:ABC-type transporter Mla MlaB component